MYILVDDGVNMIEKTIRIITEREKIDPMEYIPKEYASGTVSFNIETSKMESANGSTKYCHTITIRMKSNAWKIVPYWFMGFGLFFMIPGILLPIAILISGSSIDILTLGFIVIYPLIGYLLFAVGRASYKQITSDAKKKPEEIINPINKE